MVNDKVCLGMNCFLNMHDHLCKKLSLELKGLKKVGRNGTLHVLNMICKNEILSQDSICIKSNIVLGTLEYVVAINLCYGQ
jgi:hypothetical protein